MSRTTPTADDRFRELHEQFVCPEEACASVIYQPNVLADYRTQCFDRIRVITALCPSCGRVWTAEFILRGGVWTIYRPVRQITIPRQIAGIKARVDRVANVQLAQSA